jgi:hypothetical protein
MTQQSITLRARILVGLTDMSATLAPDLQPLAQLCGIYSCIRSCSARPLVQRACGTAVPALVPCMLTQQPPIHHIHLSGTGI